MVDPFSGATGVEGLQAPIVLVPCAIAAGSIRRTHGESRRMDRIQVGGFGDEDIEPRSRRGDPAGSQQLLGGLQELAFAAARMFREVGKRKRRVKASALGNLHHKTNGGVFLIGFRRIGTPARRRFDRRKRPLP